jgi:hypothetical protein
MGTAMRLGTGATDGTVSPEYCYLFSCCCAPLQLHLQQQHNAKGIIEKMDSVQLNIFWHAL